MEPILAGALGVVIYTVYVTIRDMIGDFRAEGFLRASRPGKALAGKWKSGVMGFLPERRDLQHLLGSDLVLVTYRSQNAYSGGRARRER